MGVRRQGVSQPVVTTTANVIYTIPTNNPTRFSQANVSASASVHHDLPPSYDQVVQSPPQTPSTPLSQSTTVNIPAPPMITQSQEVPKPA
ncbi:CLUMA_CG016335, isoform A [Clunio marinus]|uniref:CLUMA_CG016335, isoform A n=1 Tax=Clunio marinus TaxID=568069 RepID=A0A1J1ISV0_9DIPT|nr:CLUMA_CG016335, isoform A [Clunio marinus]